MEGRLARIRRELAFLDGLIAARHPDVRGIRAAQEDWIWEECLMMTNTYKFERYYNDFIVQVHTRMTKGAQEYGDGSFDRPLLNQIEEIQEELADVAGWSLVKWGSLEELKKKVIVLEGRIAAMETEAK